MHCSIMSENDIKNSLTGANTEHKSGEPALRTKAKSVNKPITAPIVFEPEKLRPMQREALIRIAEIHSALRTGKREIRSLIRYLAESGFTDEEIRALKEKNYSITGDTIIK